MNKLERRLYATHLSAVETPSNKDVQHRKEDGVERITLAGQKKRGEVKAQKG